MLVKSNDCLNTAIGTICKYWYMNKLNVNKVLNKLLILLYNSLGNQIIRTYGIIRIGKCGHK